MTYRAYFKLQFTLLSPLSIGDSFSENTDKDVVLDSRNKPVIPATSIAGVLRSLTSDKDALFGYIRGREQQQSQLIFYDAALQDDGIVTARDCVALDEFKTAKPGAKFDFQAVETGAIFVGYAEARSEDAKKALEKLLAQAFTLGSKTTRGYGKVELAYQCREFNPDAPDANAQDVLEAWLDFDMFDPAGWEGIILKQAEQQTSQGSITIKLKLKQQGGLSIRQYMTEEKGADYGPMALHDGKPVIPGTSWAGMFRHHMETLLDRNLRDVFGYVDEESKEYQRSKIMFSESKIEGGTPKLLTRNMIDRFTNGTKDGALYTELTVYGGTAKLEITLDNGICAKVKRALCATILDLHNGYAAVGGLTAVGRGLFEIVQVNGESFDGNFTKLKEVLGCV